MLSTVDELGTGRLRLPLNYITKNSITYGQPILVEYEDSGLTQCFLCTASVAAPASATAFDPSVESGLHTAPLPCSRSTQLLLSIKPVSSKVVTATSLKVLVPEHLLGSPVAAAHLQQRLLQQRCTVHLSASVSCQVLEASPSGPASAVYRVVPSTAVTLVSSSSSESAASSAGSEPRTLKPAASGSSGSSSSNSKGGNKSSSKAKSSSGAEKGTRSSSSSKAAGSSSNAASSSKQASAKKRAKQPCRESGDSSEEGAAVPASGGMYSLLDALEDN